MESELQTGKVLYGNKDKGWTAITPAGEKVTLPPEGGRIIDGEIARQPGPAERRPRPQPDTTVLFLKLEPVGSCFCALEWALSN